MKRRKWKMRAVQWRAAWRPVPCTLSWHQRRPGPDGLGPWERIERDVTVMMTRSGRMRPFRPADYIAPGLGALRWGALTYARR